MALKTPAIIWNTAEELRQCICDALNEDGTCKCPCRTCVIVGSPVFDDCCEGQLTIGMERLWVHENFPSPAPGPVFCFAPLAADFLITYIRCGPVIHDDGTPPSCEELSKSALGIYTDLYVVEHALICCLSRAHRLRKFKMGDATMINEGGCVGFSIKVTIEIEDTLSD